jgi:hypothetical protein
MPVIKGYAALCQRDVRFSFSPLFQRENILWYTLCKNRLAVVLVKQNDTGLRQGLAV